MLHDDIFYIKSLSSDLELGVNSKCCLCLFDKSFKLSKFQVLMELDRTPGDPLQTVRWGSSSSFTGCLPHGDSSSPGTAI